MSWEVNLYVVNRHGVLVDKYYVGGNKIAKLINVELIDAPGKFQVRKMKALEAKSLMQFVIESRIKYFESKTAEIIQDIDDGTYDDERNWFNLVIEERR